MSSVSMYRCFRTCEAGWFVILEATLRDVWRWRSTWPLEAPPTLHDQLFCTAVVHTHHLNTHNRNTVTLGLNKPSSVQWLYLPGCHPILQYAVTSLFGVVAVATEHTCDHNQPHLSVMLRCLEEKQTETYSQTRQIKVPALRCFTSW